MGAALNKIRAHFGNWREWELNPIVIKELRQGVRSWTVTGMLMLFLVVLFLASLTFLISESFDLNANMQLGGQMFGVFAVILAGASVFFIPLYIGVRVAAERQENNLDLLYVSTLSPARIILGKFLCGGYIVLLFFSACMPFMAFTNLLRGVDLPTVFFILGSLFVIVCATNMVAIFLACLPVSRPFKFLFVLYGIFQAAVIITPLVQYVFEMMRSGVGAMMAGRGFWFGTLTGAGLVVAITGLFFVLSVALISPPSANRALPVRLYLTAFWLVGGLLALWWVVRSGEADVIQSWTFSSLIGGILVLLVTIGNADTLSPRVRRAIPRSRLKRFFAFFFFNGAAGGLAWLAAILGVTYGVTVAVTADFPGSSLATDDKRELLTLVIYAFDYALTALLIHRRFLPGRPPKLTSLLAMMLAGGWALAPAIFLFFVNRLTWKTVEGLQLGNVFNVLYTRDSAQYVWHEYFACGWLAIIVALNLPWFFRQTRQFQPLEKTAAAPANPA